MLIDQFLPDFDFNEVHSRAISASPEQVLAVTRRVDFSEAWLTRSLLWMRGIHVATPDLAGLHAWLKFSLVGDTPHTATTPGELLFVGTLPLQYHTAESFNSYTGRGLKMAWNMWVEATPTGCRLHTETRVKCLSAQSRQRFGIYWFFIGPFSGLIRLDLLAAVARGVSRESATA